MNKKSFDKMLSKGLKKKSKQDSMKKILDVGKLGDGIHRTIDPKNKRVIFNQTSNKGVWSHATLGNFS